ncbi:MAG TPA: serine/threonine-protein kinase [Labilithrix sp.]|jgi:serine/threonine-protein kinase
MPGHPSSKRSPIVLGDGRTISFVEPIGKGTTGEVHRAVLESAWGLRRPVAIKILDVAPDDEPDEIMRRVRRIARRAVCVRHPSVVEVIDIDRVGPRPFIVTELVEGESLASIVATWRDVGLRTPVDFALVVALRVAEALGAALFTDDTDGALTMLPHGDLSPSQVLVSNRGDVKVGDFGQATLRTPSSQVRSRHRMAYTAPEVAHGLEPDARADVFSLGVILHEMLVGPRFAHGTPPADMMKMVRTGALHQTILEPNLPREVRKIVARATMSRPGFRYPHARALAFDLRREAMRLGLCDTQTSIRHAVVGWCEVRPANDSGAPPARASDVVPKMDGGDTDPDFGGYDEDSFDPPLSSNG